MNVSKRDIFILNEVITYIRKACLLYSDSRREKDIDISIRIVVNADNYINKALEGIQSILDDKE